MQAKRIYIIAGEASGDAHGAVLMREMATLVPDLQFFGAGGPEMRLIAGKHFMDWTQEAVVGLSDVLVKYPYFCTKFYQMYREIRQLKPDTVIFVIIPVSICDWRITLSQEIRRQIDLLHQSPGLGMEPEQNTADGGFPGFDDLYLSI